MQTIRFTLFISSEDYLRFYQGQARHVSAVADDGSRVKFPAEHLRPFVMHDGVKGRFELVCDENYKFVALRKI
jgi:glucose-6-phosphate isomerase